MSGNRLQDLADFYKSLEGENTLPLEPGHRFYVPLQEAAGTDAILELRTRIRFASSESVNLLTGFRGNGKSTQLRRLKGLLEEDGCKVFLVDMFSYMFMVKPVELSDFILSLMAALAAAIEDETGLNAVHEGYWKRLHSFLKSEVKADELNVGVSAAGIKGDLALKLKTDPSFKKTVQDRLRGHLTTLVQQAREFVTGLVTELRKEDPDLKVVLLVDSLEQIRGIGEEAQSIYQSVVELFSGQAQNLAFPLLHVVYTIPPYLTPMAGNISRSLGGQLIVSWPNVHVRRRDGADDEDGQALMGMIINKRFPRWSEFFSRAQLHGLARSSGGDIRNFFTLVKECTVKLNNSSAARVDDAMIKKVEQHLRAEIAPPARDDMEWLARVHDARSTALDSIENLPRLARLLDGNLIMNYENGEPWFDVHPLLLDEIERLARPQPKQAAEDAAPENGTEP